MDATAFTLFSGGAPGTEAEFGRQAEAYGVQEVTYTFDGHKIERSRGLRVLTPEELMRKDVSLSYVSKLLGRTFINAPLMRKILQTIMYQIDSGHEVFVVGTIMPDGTVRGGTGWGTEFAKICNKPIFTFDQAKNAWFRWNGEAWEDGGLPRITAQHFCGTGTRFLEDSGRKAIADLFARSFRA
jgi:hypothetical protein